MVKPEWKGTITQLILDSLWSKSALCFSVSLLSVAIFFIILRSMTKTSPYTCNIVSFEEKNVDYLSYVMTYFIAFLSFRLDSIPNILGVIFLFSFIAFVYSKSNLIYSNPVLAIFGFNIYEANLEGGKKIMIISKADDLLGKNVPLIKLTNTIYLKR